MTHHFPGRMGGGAPYDYSIVLAWIYRESRSRGAGLETGHVLARGHRRLVGVNTCPTISAMTIPRSRRFRPGIPPHRCLSWHTSFAPRPCFCPTTSLLEDSCYVLPGTRLYPAALEHRPAIGQPPWRATSLPVTPLPRVEQGIEAVQNSLAGRRASMRLSPRKTPTAPPGSRRGVPPAGNGRNPWPGRGCRRRPRASTPRRRIPGRSARARPKAPAADR